MWPYHCDGGKKYHHVEHVSMVRKQPERTRKLTMGHVCIYPWIYIYKRRERIEKRETFALSEIQSDSLIPIFDNLFLASTCYLLGMSNWTPFASTSVHPFLSL